MQTDITCKLCGHTPKSRTSCDYLHMKFFIDCLTCGKYYITDSAERCTDDEKVKEELYLVSAITRQRSENKDAEPFLVTKEILTNEAEFQAEFLSKAPKSVLGKALLLSQYIARKSSHPGDEVTINLQQDYPICFCKNAKELIFYINHTEDSGDIKRVRPGNVLSLTPKGWQKVESMARPNLQSRQAFVAMWFDESLNEIFTKGIAPLEEDTGFKMYRVDQEPFNEKICDRIIADIRKCRFFVADITGLRRAVFFEAGYAMGLGLPVIFTCRKGTRIKGGFDTRQYNHIVWKNAEDLKSKLKDRILATIGKSHR